MMISIFKQTVALVLVSVFLLQTISKVIILVNFEMNKDYIIKNLCENKAKPMMHCNGKCHLNKQLQKEDKKEQSPANPLKEKNEIQFFSEINSNISLFTPSIITILTPEYFFSLSEKHLHCVFQPPKA